MKRMLWSFLLFRVICVFHKNHATAPSTTSTAAPCPAGPGQPRSRKPPREVLRLLLHLLSGLLFSAVQVLTHRLYTPTPNESEGLEKNPFRRQKENVKQPQWIQSSKVTHLFQPYLADNSSRKTRESRLEVDGRTLKEFSARSRSPGSPAGYFPVAHNQASPGDPEKKCPLG